MIPELGQVALSLALAVAVVLFCAVTAYAIFGGADFGAGFWDLVAGGSARGERSREVIDHSIGPVCELASSSRTTGTIRSGATDR